MMNQQKENIPLFLIFIMQIFLFISPLKVATAANETCDCPKLDCGPCHDEQGVTFYSDKCGPGLSRTKSCARPTCVPKDPQPSACLSKKIIEPQSPVKNAGVTQEVRGRAIAVVKEMAGSGTLRLPDGSSVPVTIGLEVFERDLLTADKGSKIFVEFKDGNLIQVQEDSAVKVEEYEMAEEKRKAVINLLKGQLKNQVNKKYNGTTTSYEIKTKVAVAGVRGTVFMVSYKEGTKVETEIKAAEGKVFFSNKDYSESREVNAGEKVTFVASAEDVFTENDIKGFVVRGYMTPVYKMKPAEIEDVKKMRNPAKRETASAGSSQANSICQEPAADLNQCLWVCENNPKGEKACRTDLPQVACLRKRCNGNGQWAEETRLPASFYDQCQPQGYKVSPCDY